ncbi:MAG TPA: hypothetical protein VFZ66_22620 [Herpetosiphonaceae bacterium]
MRLKNSRWLQLALVGLTIVCALAVGYLTGALVGGGSPSRTQAYANLPTIDAAVTVEANATDEATPGVTATVEPTAAPTEAPTPTTEQPTSSAAPAQPDTFIEDSFDTAAHGWPSGETETWSAGVVDQRYQLRLNGQTSIGFTTPLPAENYRLGVDVAVEQGGAGLVFLFAEPATSYRIILSPDGGYAIERQEGSATTEENVVTRIVDWTDSAALQDTPGAANRLTIERQGQAIRFIVNDQPLTEFAVPPGPFVNRYGFVLTSRSGQGFATFDNLRGERLPGS